LIQTITGIFSILLFALSISAYRKTGFKKLIYAAIAFALFAVQLLIQSLEDSFELFDMGYTSLIISSMTLAILVLFFLAIVQKNK
jgi:signal transduction histidine kinase